MDVQLFAAKDPDAAFFKRLEGLQPCEMSELKAGTHIFAVYGEFIIMILIIIFFNDLMSFSRLLLKAPLSEL